MGQFIRIRSSKFPVLPGEDEELVNEGMYGKALAQYLQTRLRSRGYDAPFVCAEDWGWWVQLNGAPFTFGVCIYSIDRAEGERDYACTDGAPGRRKWSWRKLRSIDTTPWVDKLHSDLIGIFESDPEVEIVEVTDEFPGTE